MIHHRLASYLVHSPQTAVDTPGDLEVEKMDSVQVKALQVPKSSGLTETDLALFKSAGAPRRWARTPVPINDEINQRVFLYDGDIELLSADAIVNPTNENMTQLSYVSKIAGHELEDYIRNSRKTCPTGDVRVTSGFRSNYRHIIHAVPPKYQPKYKTAAETALFHTYFRVLEIMIEKKIRTIVMPTLATSKCNLPLEENCQIQLRTIRRILEKKSHEFDRIVVHVKHIETYSATFYCYFPRSSLDEEIACYHLPESLGGPNGEPVIPEREIRIKSKPAVLGLNHDASIDLTTGLDLSTVVGNTAFSKMREDLDRPGAPYGTRTKFGTGGVGGGQSSQLAVRKKPVFTGCNLF